MKNYRNKNSILKYAGILSCILALVCTGCSDDLEVSDEKAVLQPGNFATESELDLAVTGIYRDLLEAAQFTTFHVAAWGGDDITTHSASNKQDFREFDQRNVSNSNSRARDVFAGSYRVIRSANSVIVAEDDIPVDPEIKNKFIGEAYFLRGYMYFHLVRIFGRLPIVTDLEVNNEITVSDAQAVYEQIESDFMRAEELLPDVYPDVQDGAPRPNKGSAKAFLAKLYLYWAGFPVKDNSKYAQAASTAKEVIDNKEAHDFDLVDNISDVFKLENRFNKESLFTIVFCQPCGLDNRKYGKLGRPADMRGWEETLGEIKFFEDFPESARKEATYEFDLQDPDGVDLTWENFSKGETNPVIAKISPDEIPDTFQTSRNDFVMRYADLLLLFAEASARSGAVTPEAWEAYNKVRRRGVGLAPNATDASDITSGDLAELAYTERKWELAGEYERWHDLVRMERVEQALSNRTPAESRNNSGALLTQTNPIIGSLGTDNYFAPLPQAEIDLLPSLGK